MSKHTPGPWIAVTKEETRRPHGAIWYVYPDDGTNYLPVNELATVFEAGNPRATADARLIAAAPELLSAAKWAAGMASNQILELAMKQKDALDNPADIGEKSSPEYLQIFIDHWDRLRKEFQDAIDKAEGRE